VTCTHGPLTVQVKHTLLSALERAAGDDLERAQAAFKGMTPEQMQQPHGQSRMTRQAWLEMYQAHRNCIHAARVWVLSHE
jgi:hypothetical protein